MGAVLRLSIYLLRQVFLGQFDASMFDGNKEKSVVIKVYVEGDESNAQSTEILSTSKIEHFATMIFTGGMSRIVKFVCRCRQRDSAGKRGLI